MADRDSKDRRRILTGDDLTITRSTKQSTHPPICSALFASIRR
ncbi:MAG TPA: hypothetical protein VK435_05050 [Thermodesulfovibrionales bacterium]|nr:hypothetical protein [Thermodesulfovibrionales bacterium]